MRFTLNGREVEVTAHPMTRLLDVLRDECRLTGTKEGCGEGECGACTVVVNGRAVNACLVPLAQVRGADVRTIEGLGGRHPLQRAFAELGGSQCGICTPGMIMAASAIAPDATSDEVRAGLAGNLCRCTGYTGIYRAIEHARTSPARTPSTPSPSARTPPAREPSTPSPPARTPSTRTPSPLSRSRQTPAASTPSTQKAR